MLSSGTIHYTSYTLYNSVLLLSNANNMVVFICCGDLSAWNWEALSMNWSYPSDQRTRECLDFKVDPSYLLGSLPSGNTGKSISHGGDDGRGSGSERRHFFPSWGLIVSWLLAVTQTITFSCIYINCQQRACVFRDYYGYTNKSYLEYEHSDP